MSLISRVLMATAPLAIIAIAASFVVYSEMPLEERIVGSWRDEPIEGFGDPLVYTIVTYHWDGRREVFTVVDDGSHPQIEGWWMDWYEISDGELYEYGHPEPAEHAPPRPIRFLDDDAWQQQVPTGRWWTSRRATWLTRRQEGTDELLPLDDLSAPESIVDGDGGGPKPK